MPLNIQMITHFAQSPIRTRSYISMFSHTFFPYRLHIVWNSLRRIVCQILFIYQAIHLESRSHKLSDAIPIVYKLEDRSWQLLDEVEKQSKRWECAHVHFLFVVVHQLSEEVVCVIEFKDIERFVNLAHNVNVITLITQLYK